MAEGDRLFSRGDYAGAEVVFRNYLDRFPDHAPARCKRILCLYRGERLEEAESALRTMLRERRSESFVRLYLGLVLARSGKREEALAVWMGYFNIDQPLIQRAINLLMGRDEIGEEPDTEEMVAEVEAAIADQQRADRA